MLSFVTTTIVVVGVLMAIIVAIVAYTLCCSGSSRPRLSHLPSAVVVTGSALGQSLPSATQQVLQPVPRHMHQANGQSGAPMGTVIVEQPGVALPQPIYCVPSLPPDC
jgi:hypothetical protein